VQLFRDRDEVAQLSLLDLRDRETLTGLVVARWSLGVALDLGHLQRVTGVNPVGTPGSSHERY
jgi:hypothetical protein